MSSDAARQHARMEDRRRYLVKDEDGNDISTHPECPHGTYSGYTAYACRSRRCKKDKGKPDRGCADAQSEYLKDYRARRAAAGGGPLRLVTNNETSGGEDAHELRDAA